MEQANIAAPLNIYFLIDKFDIFIKNANMLLAQYIISKQKKITRLFEKNIFKVLTGKDISSNTRIFNSRFVYEIKYASINKTYEKNQLIVQAYNNQEKNLILT